MGCGVVEGYFSMCAAWKREKVKNNGERNRNKIMINVGHGQLGICRNAPSIPSDRVGRCSSLVHGLISCLAKFARNFQLSSRLRRASCTALISRHVQSAFIPQVHVETIKFASKSNILTLLLLNNPISAP